MRCVPAQMWFGRACGQHHVYAPLPDGSLVTTKYDRLLDIRSLFSPATLEAPPTS